MRAKELEEKNKDEKKGKEGDEEIVTLPVVIPASSAKVLLMVLFAHLVGFLVCESSRSVMTTTFDTCHFCL